MTTAVQTIRLEHFNIGSVLACLRYLVNEIAEGRWQPDFQLLSDIVDYMATFPEVFHHPKEEDYLFKALRRRRPETGPVLDLVHEEHVEGARMLERLRATVEAYEIDPARFDAFAAAAHDYIAFERRHMAREERELLPLALRALQAEDWAEIDAAFARNQDPLFGAGRRKEFDRLFRHILELAPTPVGFAERRPGRH